MVIVEIIIMNFVEVKKKENLGIKNMANSFNSALNILKEGLKIRSSASYAVNQNEATVKPKVCKDEVGSCVATKQKTKVFVSFG